MPEWSWRATCRWGNFLHDMRHPVNPGQPNPPPQCPSYTSGLTATGHPWPASTDSARSTGISTDAGVRAASSYAATSNDRTASTCSSRTTGISADARIWSATRAVVWPGACGAETTGDFLLDLRGRWFETHERENYLLRM